MPLLSILVSTINDRINCVPQMLLPPREDVRYVVAFQYTDKMFLEQIPSVLNERADVEVLPHPTVGISCNRNHSIQHCHTPLAILADDDVRYTNEQIDVIINTFKEHPEVTVAAFQAVDSEGNALKKYPTETFEYADQPRGYYYSSCEVAFRTETTLPLFDERLGLGSEFLACGEEEVFLYQCHKLGHRIQYFPLVVCQTPVFETTGQRFVYERRVRRSKGAVLFMLHGYAGGFLRIVKESLRWSGHRWEYLKDMLDGMVYIIRHKR